MLPTKRKRLSKSLWRETIAQLWIAEGVSAGMNPVACRARCKCLKRGMNPAMTPISIGAAATLACLYEATARKPGNVYPGADFDETTTYAAFVTSAVVIGPIIEKAPSCWRRPNRPGCGAGNS